VINGVPLKKQANPRATTFSDVRRQWREGEPSQGVTAMANWPASWTKRNQTYAMRRFMMHEFEVVHGGNQQSWDAFTGGRDEYGVVLKLVHRARQARDERHARQRS
jgi:hypothetical protein